MPSRWRSRPRFDRVMAGERSLAGHNPPFTHVVGRAFRRRLYPVTSHPIFENVCFFIGNCGRSGDGFGRSTSRDSPVVRTLVADFTATCSLT